jgi:hypothetical protein
VETPRPCLQWAQIADLVEIREDGGWNLSAAGMAHFTRLPGAHDRLAW